MKITRKNILKVLVFLGVSTFSFLPGPVLAAAEDYPVKPIIINVGFAPGGSAGIGAHIFAEGMKKYLAKPQPVIVNYKPGAQGMVAADYFMKQPADGYNLLWLVPQSIFKLATEPEKFSFKKEDFSYIAELYYSPYTLVVNTQSPFKTLEDFIDYAKKHPGEMTVSVTGLAGEGRLTAELLMREAAIELTNVPFASGAPGVLAMVGGHVTCTITTPAILIPHIKGGRARALVVFDTKHYPDIPEVPTAREKGYDVIRQTYQLVVAKKGTPKPVLDILVKLFKQTAEDLNVQSTLTKAGLIPSNLGPEEAEKKANQDFEMSREIFRKLGLVEK